MIGLKWVIIRELDDLQDPPCLPAGVRLSTRPGKSEVPGGNFSKQLYASRSLRSLGSNAHSLAAYEIKILRMGAELWHSFQDDAIHRL